MKDDHALILHTPMVCSKMAVPVILKEQLQLLILFVSLLSISVFCINFLLDKYMSQQLSSYAENMKHRSYMITVIRVLEPQPWCFA